MITLKEKDQIKIAFITPFRAYIYTTMSFGLKNAGATYQRVIQLCLANQLHRNVEAYMDDVVIKNRAHDEFITDLEETFNSLRKFRWKLNPTKCVFGVPQEKLLGFIVSHRGIKSQPGEDHRHYRHGRSTNNQGCPEAHRLYSGPE
jgi:hypothetical protein